MTEDKKGFLLRLPPPLFDELRRWAEQDMRSINGQIEWLLREAVARRAGRNPLDGRPAGQPAGGSGGGSKGRGASKAPPSAGSPSSG